MDTARAERVSTLTLFFVCTALACAHADDDVVIRRAIPPIPGSATMMCSQEAKSCPDGSYVSRTGPECTFAACPHPPGVTGRVEGRIVLSPAAPVARAGEPNERPMQGRVVAIDRRGIAVSRADADKDGLFRLDLTPGSYTLLLESAGGFGHAKDGLVTVAAGHITKTIISYDSGIR